MGPALPAGGAALVRAAAAEGPFLALVTSDSLRLAGRTLRLIGGVAVDFSFLARLTRDPGLCVTLPLPRDSARTDPTARAGAVGPLPFVAAADGPGPDRTARIVVPPPP